MIKLVVLALCASMAFANYYTGGYGGGSGGYSHEPIIIHGSYGGQLGYGGYGRYGKGYGGYGKGIGGYGGFNEGFGYGGFKFVLTRKGYEASLGYSMSTSYFPISIILK
jgi:hypothetical protein